MMRFVSPLIAVLFMCGAFAVCGYVYYDIQKSALLIADAREEIATIAARDTFAKTAAQFLAQTSAERSAVQYFVTPTEGTASAIELVEAAAKIASVDATVGSAALIPLPEPHYERLDVVVSAEGTYAGVARFATVLESLPRGAYLSSTQLEATDKGWYGTYVVSFIKQK